MRISEFLAVKESADRSVDSHPQDLGGVVGVDGHDGEALPEGLAVHGDHAGRHPAGQPRGHDGGLVPEERLLHEVDDTVLVVGRGAHVCHFDALLPRQRRVRLADAIVLESEELAISRKTSLLPCIGRGITTFRKFK